MSSRSTCRFSDSHEWFLAQGQEVTMGITQFAANELTDVTYVQLKPVGTAVKAGETVGEVESVKTTSEIYAAVAGTTSALLEVYSALSATPLYAKSDLTLVAKGIYTVFVLGTAAVPTGLLRRDR